LKPSTRARSAAGDRRHRWRPWVPAVVYAAAIFVQSAFPSPGVLHAINHIDLAFHGLGYSVLGLLVARAMAAQSGTGSRWILWLAAAGITAAYGISDEIHQAFVPGRQCDGWDMLADAVGGILGAGIWIRFHGRKADPDRSIRVDKNPMLL